jgi:putative transcriptional regulator
MSANGESQGQSTEGELRKRLGRRIVLLRQRQGWNQVSLARELGVPRERLGKWERGLNEPPLEDLVALSRVLKVSLEELGLGCRAQRSVDPALAPADLRELNRLVQALTRLLKPWLQGQAPRPPDAR